MTRNDGLPLRRPLVAAAMLVQLALGLSACEPARSYDRAADGSIVYLDQLSDAEKANARDRIVQTLNRGFDRYELQIGDEVEIFFHVNRRPTRSAYVISATDKLRIEFLNEGDKDRVVQVRPDGRISVPLIGPVVAAGKTADALSRELEGRYAGLLENPQITVNLTEIHSPLDDFVTAVGPTGRQRSLIDKVLPDGTMSVPLAGSLPARGRTLQDLQRAIDAAYAAKRLDVAVSLVPRALRAGTVLVFGEVGKPGRIESDKPLTVLMTIAQAGGVLPTGSLEGIRVFYVGEKELPRVRLVNLKEVMEDLRIEQDMVLPANSVIYVPPTELAKTGRILDAVLRDVLRFQGFSIGGTFLLNQSTTGGTTVVQPSP